MAPVRLSDAVIPDVYLSYTTVNDTEKLALVASGVIASNEALNAVATNGGKFTTVPFWEDLDGTIEQNYSNDDPDDLATPNAIGSGTMTARASYMNQGFAAMRLVSELAGSNPMERIRDRFGAYWQKRLQRRVIATAMGLYRENAAAENDMIANISGGVGDAAKFGRTPFLDAAYTMGDNVDVFNTVIVNSAIMRRMVDADDIVYVPDSEGRLTIPTYLGRRVIMDDGLLPISGTGADRVYVSILMGGGSFGFGSAEGGSPLGLGVGVPNLAVEVESNARSGNGGGEESIWERKTWVLHPFGYDWVEGSGADALVEFSPTDAELANGKHFDRILERRQIPLAFVVSKA